MSDGFTVSKTAHRKGSALFKEISAKSGSIKVMDGEVFAKASRSANAVIRSVSEGHAISNAPKRTVVESFRIKGR